MIRVNLLPREEKNQRKSISFNFKVGDMVLPAAVLGLAAAVIAGTTLSQRSRITGLESSIQQVDT